MKRREFLVTAGLIPLTGMFFPAAEAITETVTGSAVEPGGQASKPEVLKTVRRYLSKNYKWCPVHPYSDENKLVLEAAINEDWETLKQCLDRDSSLLTVKAQVVEIYKNDDKKYPPNYYVGLTLFHIVATWSSNAVEALKYLVSIGTDVNIRGGNDRIPLHLAATWSNRVEVLQFLVSQGADVHTKDLWGRTPLHYAADNKLESAGEILKYLESV